MPGWPFYLLAERTGAIRSTAVDMSLMASAPQPKRPFALWVMFGMLQPGTNGLTSPAEALSLQKSESRIVEVLTARLDAAYVAQINRSGRFEMYFYAADAAELRDIVADIRQDLPQYNFSYGSKFDPNWNAYRQEFYPSTPALKQQVLNFSTIEALKAKGVSLTEPKVVEHRLSFASSNDRDRFISGLVNDERLNVYVHQQAGVRPYCTSLKDNMIVDLSGVNRRTWKLIGLAEQAHGTYDGWQVKL